MRQTLCSVLLTSLPSDWARAGPAHCPYRKERCPAADDSRRRVQRPYIMRHFGRFTGYFSVNFLPHVGDAGPAAVLLAERGMAVPPPGSRVQDLGDRLLVRLGPRRFWLAVAFLLVWLPLWTLGGVHAATSLPDADLGGRVFLAFWLCGWVLGELGAAFAILWMVFGRDFLLVTADGIERRRELGPFARVARYEAPLIEDVRAAVVPDSDDDGPRSDFGIEISYRGRDVHVGEWMTADEAEAVAEAVWAWIRPRSWWDGDRARPSPRARSRPEPEPQRPWLGLIGLGVFIAIAGGLAVLDDDAEELTRPAATANPAALYASAETAQALRRMRVVALEPPDCGDVASSHEWRCTVRARATDGPLVGRTLNYYCERVPAEPKVTTCGATGRSRRA